MSATAPTTRPLAAKFLRNLTTPNSQLEARVRDQPLMTRNPLLGWQLIAGVLLLINLLQALL
jgi:hypothetical protein